MKDWVRVGENLQRHKGGTIYLRAWVAGKVIRVSLETKDLRLAKIARDAKLDLLRAAAAEPDMEGADTIGGAIGVLAMRSDMPHLKESTKLYYRDMIKVLRETLDVSAPVKTWKPEDAAAWWRVISTRYSAQRANNLLSFAKKLGEIIVETGAMVKNPAAPLKKVSIPKTNYTVPGLEDMQAIIADIRRQGKSRSEEAANLCAFLAFSGCRPAEPASILWSDVGADWIRVTGGAVGTKNRKTKTIPINPLLREVIDGMRYEGASGPLFYLKSCRNALENACLRLGLPHMHRYLLRHFFATYAIEQGVDCPTLAGWMGHSDGGVLAMRTYGHVRNDHSLAMSERMATKESKVAGRIHWPAQSANL
jgi:integrase